MDDGERQSLLAIIERILTDKASGEDKRIIREARQAGQIVFQFGEGDEIQISNGLIRNVQGNLIQAEESQGFIYRPSGPVQQIFNPTYVNVPAIHQKKILEQDLDILVEIQAGPPVAIEAIASNFVGREKELAYYAEKLASRHLAVITGMAGVGKTWLAIQLAYKVASPETTFWHTFHSGEGMDALIWELAAFLVKHGQDDVRPLLYNPWQSGGQSPPTEVVMDYLIQMIQGRNFLLCLDDFHNAGPDPHLEAFLSKLINFVSTGAISIILTSRTMPAFVKVDEFKPLDGLVVVDIHQLLRNNKLTLASHLVVDLQEATGGNAQVLILAIDAIKHGKDPDELIGRLTEVQDIERYLLKEVHEGLSASERLAMGAISILQGYSGTRDAIETILDQGSVREELIRLTDRNLLLASAGPLGTEYRQHALIEAFYYDLLGRQERRKMHFKAGEYYETEEPDMFRAANHYEKAGEYQQAASLATRDIWLIINQGRVRALQLLLAHLRTKQLDDDLCVATDLALGELYSLLGEEENAKKSYQRALSHLEKLPDTSAYLVLQARACRGLASIYEWDDPQEALEWLQRGLAAVSGNNPAEEAALYIKLGSIHIALGNLHSAASDLDHGLSILPVEAEWLRAGALLNKAAIHGMKGEYDLAGENTVGALKIYEQLNDSFRIIDCRANLGLIKDFGGKWPGAVGEYEKALYEAVRIGSISQQARLNLHIGIISMNQGEDEKADERLEGSLQLARQSGNREIEIATLSSLSQLYIRRKEVYRARSFNSEAEKYAIEMGALDQQVEIYNNWAEIWLVEGNQAAAEDSINKSLALTQELELEREHGIALRILGMIQSEKGEANLAKTTLHESLNTLESLDPYEAARTKMVWGAYLLSTPHRTRAISLHEEARQTFWELGAKRELAEVNRIFEDINSRTDTPPIR